MARPSPARGRPSTPTSSVGCPGSPAATGTAVLQWAPGFWRQFSVPGGGGGAETVYGPCPAAAPAGIHLFWASPDGKVVLGILNPFGNAEFGLFSGGRDFVPLGPVPGSILLSSMAW